MYLEAGAVGQYHGEPKRLRAQRPQGVGIQLSKYFIVPCPTPRFSFPETAQLRADNSKMNNPTVLAGQVHQERDGSSLTMVADYQKAYNRVKAKTGINEDAKLLKKLTQMFRIA